MIDVFIVILSLISFLFYMFLQFLFLRTVPVYERPGFLLRLYVLMSIFLASSLIMMIWLRVITLQTFFIVGILSEGIFAGLCLLYMMTVFSYIESSITLKLFLLIGRKTKAGLDRKELHQLYSKKHIIQRRIDRFIFMHMIERSGMMFIKRESVSLFTMRDSIVVFMNMCFPPYTHENTTEPRQYERSSYEKK